MHQPKRGKVLLTCILLVTAGTVLAAPTAAVAQTANTFLPTDDSYADASNPTTNYDNAGRLVTAASPSRISYLRFSVAGLTEPVIDVRLWLRTTGDSYAGSPTGGTVQSTGTSWQETTLTWANRPATVGTALGMVGSVQPNGWYSVDVTRAVTGAGVVSFGIFSTNPDGAYYDDRESMVNSPRLVVTTGVPATGDNTILAAGDIASCGSDRDEATARLLDQQPGTVAAIGDTVYESGTAAEFANCYAPTWGRHKARTRPAVGNHEYLTPGAAPYWAYFGAAAGPAGRGYYSYSLPGAPDWHIVVLNSNCSQVGGCQFGSAQEQWLRADLAAHPTRCTLAYWHHPTFSSGGRESTAVLPLMEDLYAAGAEIVLNGHNHQYERFAPQTPTRMASATRGIREFVVGTGGRSLQQSFPTIAPNSQVRNGSTYGVLRLILHSDGYLWRFLPINGQAFTDSGEDTCH